MNNSAIIHKKPGKMIDDRYLAAALAACPSAIGTVVRMGEDLEVSNHIGVPPLEKVKEALDVAKDHEVCLWLGSLTDHKNIKQEYIQPFLWTDEGKNLMAVMVEGDFSKFSDPGKGDEWSNAFNKLILTSLQDQATLAGGDWDKFLERLNGDAFEATMMGSVSHRGAMMLIPFKGDVIGLAKDNHLGAEYDWGSVSQTFGFDPNKKVEEPKKEEPKKSSGFFSFGKKAEAQPTKVEPKPDAKPDAKPEVKVEPDKTAVKGKWVDVPKNLKGKARKSHIRKIMGLKSGDDLPDGWFQDDFKAFVPETVKVQDLKDIGKAIEAKKTDTAVKGNVGEYPAKEVSPPVISDKNKLAVMDFVTKRLAANSQTMADDPKKMAELEDKVPSFSEATGVKLEDTFRLFFQDFKVLQETYPTEFILMLMEYRRAYISTLAEDEPEIVVEPKKEEIVEEPKKVAAGGGKGFFSFGKK